MSKEEVGIACMLLLLSQMALSWGRMNLADSSSCQIVELVDVNAVEEDRVEEVRDGGRVLWPDDAYDSLFEPSPKRSSCRDDPRAITFLLNACAPKIGGTVE